MYDSHFCQLPTALLVQEGKLMRKMDSDPIKWINYLIGTELRTDDNNIAKRVYQQYFNSEKKFEEQLDDLENVIDNFLLND